MRCSDAGSYDGGVKRASWILFLAMLLVIVNAAQAFDRTGYDLYRQALAYHEGESRELSKGEALAAMEYRAYIGASLDMLAKMGVVCLSDSAAYSELMAPVYNALRDDPALRQGRRSSIVYEVLTAQYPCGQIAPKQPLESES
ncbi:MAG: Rap1a/Tai family immunity protein [Pseudomonadota bacterium]